MEKEDTEDLNNTNIPQEPFVRKVSIKQKSDILEEPKTQSIKSDDVETCSQVQERMATYEALSEMRSNTLPELQVIERFVDTLPERCSHIYGKFQKLVEK